MANSCWRVPITFVAFVIGSLLLSQSKVDTEQWHSFLKVRFHWTLVTLWAIDLGIAVVFQRRGPIQYEVLASKWGFILKSSLEIAVCLASTYYSSFILKKRLIDGRLISSLMVFAFHSLSLGRILWPGVDITCMVMLIQTALSFGIEVNNMVFAIIVSVSFCFFILRAYLESSDVIRRANNIRSKKPNLVENRGAAGVHVVETEGGAADDANGMRKMFHRMRNLLHQYPNCIFFICNVAAFLGTFFALSFTKMNSQVWDSFVRKGNYAVWIIVVVHCFLAAVIAIFGPIRFDTLTNPWGFVIKPVFEVAVFSGATWLLNFIDEKKALDASIIVSLMIFAFHSLTLGRMLWPGVDISCMVLIIEMSVNLSIEVSAAAFISTGAAGFCLLLARAYFESCDIIRRAGEVEDEDSNAIPQAQQGEDVPRPPEVEVSNPIPLVSEVEDTNPIPQDQQVEDVNPILRSPEVEVNSAIHLVSEVEDSNPIPQAQQVEDNNPIPCPPEVEGSND